MINHRSYGKLTAPQVATDLTERTVLCLPFVAEPERRPRDQIERQRSSWLSLRDNLHNEGMLLTTFDLDITPPAEPSGGVEKAGGSDTLGDFPGKRPLRENGHVRIICRPGTAAVEGNYAIRYLSVIL
ncbi:MAG: hypothetical protein ABIS86_20405 [Streptosporangiaceae bacterium]